MQSMSTLYIVATPIGNLEDITLRALRVLKEVDLVLCEDTRVTHKLLDHYEIKKPLESFHEHSDRRKLERIIKLLESDKNIAFVTDAGTPGISDPGAELIQKIKARPLEFSISGLCVEIIPIPGPSALTTLMSVAGIRADRWIFTGFIPQKKGRETFFKWLAREKEAVVCYESVHRILKTLDKLALVLDSKRKITIGRELTKMYENVRTGAAEELYAYYRTHPEEVHGEFTIVVEGLG